MRESRRRAATRASGWAPAPTPGRVVRRRPVADTLDPLPRRGGRGRVPVAGTRAVRLSAQRQGAAGRRAQPARPGRGRRHRTRVQRLAPAGRLAGHRRDHPPGVRAHRRGRRAARDLRAGARLPRRLHRCLPRARRTRRRAMADHDPGHRRPGQDGRGGVRPGAAVPPARGQPRGNPGPDRAVPGQTDPRYVSLCLDTGHLAYRHADNVAIINRYPTASATCTSSRWTRPSWPRPTARASPSARPWPWAPAASRPRGTVVEDVAKALRALDRDLFVVVEQDMYPCDFGQPKPIAQRTYTYLRSLGIGEE
jgi:hypothetical protein